MPIDRVNQPILHFRFVARAVAAHREFGIDTVSISIPRHSQPSPSTLKEPAVWYPEPFIG